MPGHRWNEVCRRCLLTGNEPLGDRLARVAGELGRAVEGELPPGSENPNELPDLPQVVD